MRIGRLGSIPRAGRRRSTAGAKSRGGAVRGSPEFAENDAPRVKLTGLLVREVWRNTRNPPRVIAGLVEALGGEHKSGGGSAWRDSPACMLTHCSGLRNGGNRLWVRAQCKNKMN